MRVLCRGPDGNTHGTPFQPSPPSSRRPCDETAMGQTSGTTTRATPSPPTSYRRGSARRLSTESSPLFQSQVRIPFAAKTAAFSSPGASHPQTAPLVPPCKSTELAPASPPATHETNPSPRAHSTPHPKRTKTSTQPISKTNGYHWRLRAICPLSFLLREDPLKRTDVNPPPRAKKGALPFPKNSQNPPQPLTTNSEFRTFESRTFF